MPVGHSWQKCKLKSNKCPCCVSPNETFEHLLECKNDRMEQGDNEAYTSIQGECSQLELPLHFTATLPKGIKVTLEGSTPYTVAENDPLSKATVVQTTRGYYRMVIGLVTK